MSAGIRSGVHWTRLASRPSTAPKRLDQARLGEARHADEQGVTPSEQRDKRAIDDLRLAEDHPADALAHLAQAFAQFLDVGNKVARRRGDWGEFRLGSVQCSLSRMIECHVRR